MEDLKSIDELQVVSLKKAIERGDAPALAALHKNEYSRYARHAEETKEELDKISSRVSNTLTLYEKPELYGSRQTNEASFSQNKSSNVNQEAALEFVDDLAQLMMILSDPLAKRKYQQYVTIFVVGYENVCGNRLDLLTQINSFFIKNSKNDEEFPDLDFPEFDIDKAGRSVRSALDRATKTQEKLQSVSNEVIEALEELSPKKHKNRKKKAERLLQQARENIAVLTEKLLAAQNELSLTQEQLNHHFSNTQAKQVEIERLKSQVTSAKAREPEDSDLKKQLEERNDQYQSARQEIDRLNLDLAHVQEKLQQNADRDKNHRKQLEKLEYENDSKLEAMQRTLADTRKSLEDQAERQLSELKEFYKSLADQKDAEHTKVVQSMELQINELVEAGKEAEKQLEKLEAQYLSENANSELRNKQAAFKATASVMRNNLNRKPSVTKEPAPMDPTSLLIKKQEDFMNGNIKSVGMQTDIPLLDKKEMESELDLQKEDIVESDLGEFSEESFNAMKTNLMNLKDKYNTNIETMLGLSRENRRSKLEYNEMVERLDQSRFLKEAAEKEAEASMIQLEALKIENESLIKELPPETATRIIVSEAPDKTDGVSSQLHQIGRLSISQMSGRAKNRLIVSAGASCLQDLLSFYRSLLKLKDDFVHFLELEDLTKEKTLLVNLELLFFSMDVDSEQPLEDMKIIAYNAKMIVENMQSLLPTLFSTDDEILFEGLKSTSTFNINVQSASSKASSTEDVPSHSSPDYERGLLHEHESRMSASSLKIGSENKGEALQLQKPKSGRARLVEDYKTLVEKHSTLVNQYQELESQFNQNTKEHEDVVSSNKLKIKQLEVSIGMLKKEYKLLSDLKKPETTKSVHQDPNLEPVDDVIANINDLQVEESEHLSSVGDNVMENFMFTHNDVEFNNHMLQRGINQGRISEAQVKDAHLFMNEYARVARMQLRNLALRYSHHVRMVEAENRLATPKRKQELDPQAKEISTLLDRLEYLQTKRMKRRLQNTKQLSEQRMRLANELIRRLKEIEEQTGIFLIKPIRTLPSRGTSHGVSQYEQFKFLPKDIDVVKNRYQKHRTHSYDKLLNQIKQHSSPSISNERCLSDSTLSVSTKAMSATEPTTFWKPPPANFGHVSEKVHGLTRVPRMLEMDINRSMFSTNLISAPVKPYMNEQVADQHLNLISYMTSNRTLNHLDIRENGCISPDENHVFSLPPVQTGKVRIASNAESRRSVSTIYSDAERPLSPIPSKLDSFSQKSN